MVLEIYGICQHLICAAPRAAFLCCLMVPHQHMLLYTFKIMLLEPSSSRDQAGAMWGCLQHFCHTASPSQIL